FEEAHNKTENGLLVEVKRTEVLLQHNVIAAGVGKTSRFMREAHAGTFSLSSNRPLAIRAIGVRQDDYCTIRMTYTSCQPNNLEELVDFVALGNETFHTLGCASCHATKENDPSVKSGPNLFGLFKRTPRDREVVEGENNHRFTIKADRNYLINSIRTPAAQRAVAEKGGAAGEAYLPIMPPYSEQAVSNKQADAIA